MVDKEIVLDTVKKMYASGIDDDVVKQTLKDIGLGDKEILQYIAEAKGESVPVTSSEPKPLEARKIATEEKPEHVAMHTTTHVALEAQSEKTNELLAKISGLEKQLQSKNQSKPSSDLIAINQRLAVMEKDLKELKADLGATKSIMEKILETDRKTLSKL